MGPSLVHTTFGRAGQWLYMRGFEYLQSFLISLVELLNALRRSQAVED